MLERVRVAYDERNAVVHSLWPSPSLERAFRWRPVSRPQRPADAPDEQWIAEADVDGVDLREQVARLVELIEELGNFTDHVRAAINRAAAQP